jgi:short-chain fatty acids transporter
MNLFSGFSASLTNFSQKFVPSSFVIALILTLFTFILGLAFTGSNLYSLIQYWGTGFWELISFAMQMCLVIMTGYIVAVSPLVSRFLNFLAGLPKGPKSSILLMVIISTGLSFLHWGLSLIASAVMVRYIAAKQTKVDYPLLVASAYLGMGCTWHAGLSGSAPLLMATPGNFLEKDFGLVPTSQTLFSSFNLVLLLGVFLFLGVLVPNLHPPAEKTKSKLLLQPETRPPESKKQRNWSYRLDQSPVLGILFGGLGMVWLLWHFLSKKGSLNLDVLNFLFLFLGILLHLRPSSFLKAAEEGGKLVYGIILQFPFYAGMFGIIKYSGLAEVAARFFVQISTERLYPVIVYWYSGIVNYFVPSGGSKWAIEAPYLLQAAHDLGVPNSKVVISYAWGDMATDLIQPFWAIPLLSVAGLDFKDIMGYLILIFALYWSVVSLVFLLVTF